MPSSFFLVFQPHGLKVFYMDIFVRFFFLLYVSVMIAPYSLLMLVSWSLRVRLSTDTATYGSAGSETWLMTIRCIVCCAGWECCIWTIKVFCSKVTHLRTDRSGFVRTVSATVKPPQWWGYCWKALWSFLLNLILGKYYKIVMWSSKLRTV